MSGFRESVIDRRLCVKILAAVAVLVSIGACGGGDNQSDIMQSDIMLEPGPVAEPNITVSQNPYDFGMVTLDSGTVQQAIVIMNSGNADLEISGVEAMAWSEGFSFKYPCERFTWAGAPEEWMTNSEAIISLPVSGDASSRRIIDEAVCKSPLRIEPGHSASFPVYYSPVSTAPAKVLFRLFSNDPDFDQSMQDAYEVAVQANIDVPCITVIPSIVTFGIVAVGIGAKSVPVEIYSCGELPLAITGIELVSGFSEGFSLDTSSVGQVDDSNPVVLGNDESISIIAKYSPVDVSPKVDGFFEPDTGLIRITNNSANPVVEVPMDGVGVEPECAVCQFTMQVDGVNLADGADVLPQEDIKFINDSYDPVLGGGIDSYLWTVDQPSDSVQVFLPTSTYETPTFEPLIAGQYEFCLEVTNSDGCVDKCCQKVDVVPPEGCHVELTWKTPNDPDESDTCGPHVDCGSDMDLHLVHPLATGEMLDPETESPYGFFDPKYDCIGWANPHPQWDEEHPGDPLYMPNFDLDDNDGAGPENFTYTRPDPNYSTTPPNCYRIGVHYYDDHTFGKSFPTVRVFVNGGKPVFEKTMAEGMSMLDMWDVGYFCCSNVQAPFVERVNQDKSPHVIHNYAVPWFQ